MPVTLSISQHAAWIKVDIAKVMKLYRTEAITSLFVQAMQKRSTPLHQIRHRNKTFAILPLVDDVTLARG